MLLLVNRGANRVVAITQAEISCFSQPVALLDRDEGQEERGGRRVGQWSRNMCARSTRREGRVEGQAGSKSRSRDYGAKTLGAGCIH